MRQGYSRIPGVIKTIKSLNDREKQLDSLVKKEIKIINLLQVSLLITSQKITLFSPSSIFFPSNQESATFRCNFKTIDDAGQAFNAQSAGRRVAERKIRTNKVTSCSPRIQIPMDTWLQIPAEFNKMSVKKEGSEKKCSF